MVPLAVVGMDFREGPTAVRAALVALDSGEGSPSAELIASGAALGIARLETCSRCEWAISSTQPQWAGELLRSALLSRVPGARTMHLKVGVPASHYLMRVAAGLESVAEGEAAVGRQVLRGFERSHADSRTDKILNAGWRIVGALIHHRRVLAPSASAVGVHTLVVDALTERVKDTSKAHVLVFGQGQIGKAVTRTLTQRGGFVTRTFNRQTVDQFRSASATAAAVIICSGADAAWLELPHRKDKPLAIDIGSPEQIAAAPGWSKVALDHLLAKDGLALPENERIALEELVTDSAEMLLKELTAPSRSKALEAIDSERKEFLEVELPRLLAGLPVKEQKRLRASIASFTHSVIKRTRSEL